MLFPCHWVAASSAAWGWLLTYEPSPKPSVLRLPLLYNYKVIFDRVVGWVRLWWIAHADKVTYPKPTCSKSLCQFNCFTDFHIVPTESQWLQVTKTTPVAQPALSAVERAWCHGLCKPSAHCLHNRLSYLISLPCP
jgi:hypothetical protein